MSNLALVKSSIRTGSARRADALSHLLLSGGSDAEESRLLDEVARSPHPSGLIHVVASYRLATVERHYGLCYRRIQSVFAPLGLTSIVMWTNLENKTDRDLHPFLLSTSGAGTSPRCWISFKRPPSYLSCVGSLTEEGIVYGTSAGAMILGQGPLTAVHAATSHHSLAEAQGLGFIPEFFLRCHYAPVDDPLIASSVEHRQRPIIALSDGAGLHVRDGVISVVGFDPAVVFTATARHVFPPVSLVLLEFSRNVVRGSDDSG